MEKFVIRKAVVEDCSQMLTLIKELALYEKAPQEVAISEKELATDGFGAHAIYDALVAEQNNQLIGLAIFYEKYSTWKGRALYLEDLIITEKARGQGAGKALFDRVIKEAQKRGSGRMEWQVLDWNQSAIDFYKSYGAELDPEWINGRFQKQQIQKFDFKEKK